MVTERWVSSPSALTSPLLVSSPSLCCFLSWSPDWIISSFLSPALVFVSLLPHLFTSPSSSLQPEHFTPDLKKKKDELLHQTPSFRCIERDNQHRRRSESSTNGASCFPATHLSSRFLVVTTRPVTSCCRANRRARRTSADVSSICSC